MDIYNLIFSGGFKNKSSFLASEDKMNKEFESYVEGTLNKVDREMVEGITAIRDYALYEYDNLTEITIPSTVNSFMVALN